MTFYNQKEISNYFNEKNAKKKPIFTISNGKIILASILLFPVSFILVVSFSTTGPHIPLHDWKYLVLLCVVAVYLMLFRTGGE